MQLQCPQCSSRDFDVYANVRSSIQYSYSSALRPELNQWEDDLEEAYLEPCGFCDECQNENGAFCENLSNFDVQYNNELMTKPSEQKKLTMELDSSEADEEQEEFTVTLIDCANCSFKIEDPEILAAIQTDWR